MDEMNFRDSAEEDLAHLEAPEAHEEREREAKPQQKLDGQLPEPLFRIKISHSSELVYGYAESPDPIPAPCQVIVISRYGKDMGLALGVVKTPGYVDRDEIVKIDRVATEEDLARWEHNKRKEAEAFEVCRKKIESHRLAMKLVTAHYLIDEPKILFFFTAEARVDFRELVKDLVSVFKTRIELRQIGVRDEARVVGGTGVCGRVFCCHGISDKLNAVSIKMAKDQNLSLNSMKISGPCGRLLCCLSYEYAFYRDERRSLPLEGAKFEYDGTMFRVIEINILKGRVRISGEDARLLDLPASRFRRNENGKWMVLPGDDGVQKPK